MKRDGFRELLTNYEYAEEQITQCVSGVEGFADSLQAIGKTLEQADADDVQTHAAELVAQGQSERNGFVGLYHYAGMIANYPMQIAVLELFDGFEIFGNLHRAIGEKLGTAAQAALFEGVELPAFGTTQLVWTQATSIVVPRLEAAADRETVERILGSGLRDLSDDNYADFKTRFEEMRDIDAFLEDRGKRHLDRLIEHAERGTPYFSQMIDESVLDFVRRTPEIGRGVRQGNTIVETKIPHQAIEYLATADDRTKQYHVCHCPCVKESIPRDDIDISPTFCVFCPAFNAKPWEVTFGQRLKTDVLESALRGGLVCTFAIHLPEGAI